MLLKENERFVPGDITQSIFRPAARRKEAGKAVGGDRRDGGLKMGWTKPLPTRGLWVLIVGWISGEDPIDPEVMSAREFLRHRAASRYLW